MDSDGFPTRVWKVDPMEYFIENEGVVMFDHFPMGSIRLPRKIYRGFNKTLCKLQLNQTSGNLVADYEGCRESPGVPTIHGFFHITDLDFYRSAADSLKRVMGDCYLCRNPDDQLAVTLPAAFYAPDKAWEMSLKGFDLKVFHNFKMDGKKQMRPAGFRKHWRYNASMHFPTADANCKITEPGR